MCFKDITIEIDQALNAQYRLKLLILQLLLLLSKKEKEDILFQLWARKISLDTDCLPKQNTYTAKKCFDFVWIINYFTYADLVRQKNDLSIKDDP